MADFQYNFCLFACFFGSPMVAAKARCTIHSFLPQCCHHHLRHQWLGLCLCQCQTQNLQPHQQKEGPPLPLLQVSIDGSGIQGLPAPPALGCAGIRTAHILGKQESSLLSVMDKTLELLLCQQGKPQLKVAVLFLTWLAFHVSTCEGNRGWWLSCDTELGSLGSCLLP